MNATERDAVAVELMAQLQIAAERAANGSRERARMKLACANMDRIRDEIRREHGVLDIGVTAIRELRDS